MGGRFVPNGVGLDEQRLEEADLQFLILGRGPGKAATFCLSQRAEHIWEGVSSATTRSRPIINTRDEPHADSLLVDWSEEVQLTGAECVKRIDVTVGDIQFGFELSGTAGQSSFVCNTCTITYN